MYKIKRNHILEDLEIEDNDKKLNLTVDIDVDRILKQYMEAGSTVAKAQESVKNGTGQEEALGEAILALFCLIFGEDQTKQLVDFYGERYLEMLSDVVPFINDVITPRIMEARKRIEDSYKQVKRK